MRLERDNIPLDKEFPFHISEVELTPANSRPGSYHWHSYFEITCVLGGKGNYFVNGQEYTMEEDDIIIFNNVEPHGWKLIGGDMKLLVMIFSPDFVAEKLSIFDTEYLKPFVERGSNFKNRIGREEEVSGEIRSSILPALLSEPTGLTVSSAVQYTTFPSFTKLFPAIPWMEGTEPVQIEVCPMAVTEGI